MQWRSVVATASLRWVRLHARCVCGCNWLRHRQKAGPKAGHGAAWCNAWTEVGVSHRSTKCRGNETMASEPAACGQRQRLPQATLPHHPGRHRGLLGFSKRGGDQAVPIRRITPHAALLGLECDECGAEERGSDLGGRWRRPLGSTTHPSSLPLLWLLRAQTLKARAKLRGPQTPRSGRGCQRNGFRGGWSAS